MTVGQEGAEEVEAVTLGARAEEEETQGEEEEVRPGGLEGGGEDLKEVAEEVVAVTGVMRGGVKMEITGVTQEIEEEGVMEEAFPELVGEVVRRGAAVVAEEAHSELCRRDRAVSRLRLRATLRSTAALTT